MYPPGSTFKVITGATALEAKMVTPEEKIFDNGRHWLIDKRNSEGEAFGWVDFMMPWQSLIMCILRDGTACRH